MYKKMLSKKKLTLITTIAIFMIILGGYLIYHNISLNNNIVKNDKNLIESSNQANDTISNDTISSEGKLEEEDKHNFEGATLINDAKGVPVLYYHSVKPSADNEVTISPQMLRNELQYLKNTGYITLTMSELKDYILNNAPIPANSIVITFDDGYMDNYTNAFPILKDLGMKATIFCITFKLDGSYYLSKDAIKEMSKYGLDIQSHTVGHPELNTMTYNEQLAELKESKETLESITGKSVISLAYPYGKFNDDSIKVAKEAGYSLAFTTKLGLADRTSNPLKLNRIYVSSNYDLNTFKEILANANK